jgi:HPt (histidine-containing phosphotransfer) domain-containing protein
MDGFLSKPIRPVELRQCLDRWGRELQDRQQLKSEDRELRIKDQGSKIEKAILDSGRNSESATTFALMDEDVLADLCELDADESGMLHSFVQGFRQAVPEHIAAMRQALAEHDGEQLRKVAHRLKGTAANVAACGVAEQCQALEMLGRSGALADGLALISELERRFRQTNEFFTQIGVLTP